MKSNVLIPFKRATGEYEKLACYSVPVEQCSLLVKTYHPYGVEGYCLADIKGGGYLNHFMRYEGHQVPTLIFRKHFLVPLLFRQDSGSQRLFQDPRRWQSFLMLLDWYMAHKPQEVVVGSYWEASSWDVGGQPVITNRQKIIDTAFLVFRLTEIIDAAGLPLSQIETMAAFIQWNRQVRLIDNGGGVGRHSRIFDQEDPLDHSQLALILRIVSQYYPFTKDFLPASPVQPLSV